MQIERYIERYGNLLRFGRRKLLLFRVEDRGEGGAVLYLVEGGRWLRAWLRSRRPSETWVLESGPAGRRGAAFCVSDHRIVWLGAR